MITMNRNALAALFENERLMQAHELPAPESGVKAALKPTLMLAQSAEETLPQQESETLQRLIAAIRVKPDEVEIIVSRSIPPFHYLKKKYACEKILLFGFDEKDLQLNFPLPLHEPVIFGNTTLLRTEPVSIVSSNKQVKEMLWRQLQIIFRLK